MSKTFPWLVRSAIGYGRIAVRRGAASAATLLGRVEPPKRPLSAVAGEAPLGRRVVVFCHFDGRGRVAEHVRRYLTALVEAGLSVVFVTNAGRLEPEADAWLRPRCAWIVVRRNIGFDFAAWRDGMVVAGLPTAETELLCIANDSVYGPLRALEPVLTRMDFEAADVWALTDSWQVRFHLQSYLVAFGARALQSPAFARFWRQVRDLRSKEAVIRQYEIGLTHALLDGGLTCAALWPYTDTLSTLRGGQPDEEVRPAAPAEPLGDVQRHAEQRILGAAARRIPLNPTADLWRPLLVAGFPFVKRELLRKNPAHVPDVAAWLDLARATSPDGADVILRDLRSSLRKSAP
jgi:hypothetical protein